MPIILGRKPGGGGGSVAGVTSIAESGQPALTGAVTLSEGENVTLTQVGQDIEIAAAAGTSFFDLIEDQLLAAPAAFDFQNIPGTYKHLQIEYQVRATDAGTVQVQMRFNNDSGANYGTQIYQANAGTNVPSDVIGATQFRTGNAPGTGSGSSGSGTIKIPNYATTTLGKTFSAMGGYHEGTAEDLTILNGQWGWWNNTAVINRVTIFPSAGTTFVIGSRATLYGLG